LPLFFFVFAALFLGAVAFAAPPALAFVLPMPAARVHAGTHTCSRGAQRAGERQSFRARV
jgi:hypothetical protein